MSQYRARRWLVRWRKRRQHQNANSKDRILGESRVGPGASATENDIRTNAGTIHGHQCIRPLVEPAACSRPVSLSCLPYQAGSLAQEWDIVFLPKHGSSCCIDIPRSIGVVLVSIHCASG
ncbi:hypothetical protein IG631_13467 [Alternaria alternata]|nr:hypothetical protein IG631_13467 [Alternaria alternata]